MTFPLRIIHPEHGAMHVYNVAEWETHKARGWQIEEPEVPAVERKKSGPKPKAA